MKTTSGVVLVLAGVGVCCMAAWGSLVVSRLQHNDDGEARWVIAADAANAAAAADTSVSATPTPRTADVVVDPPIEVLPATSSGNDKEVKAEATSSGVGDVDGGEGDQEAGSVGAVSDEDTAAAGDGGDDVKPERADDEDAVVDKSPKKSADAGGGEDGGKGGGGDGGKGGSTAAAPAGKGGVWRPPKGNRKVKPEPYVRLRPDEVRIDGGCKFEGCPAGKPFVYYLTSYRNRGASLNRWLRSAAVDIKSDVNTFPAQCVCHGVADYNDVTSGVPLEAALEDWPYDRAVIHLHGAFSRAGGFQRCLDHIVTTPRNQSLVFFVDADMVAYPGLLNRIVENTVEGVVRRRARAVVSAAASDVPLPVGVRAR
jgi:hypothetical protein